MPRRALPTSRRQYGVSTPARDLARQLPGVVSATYPGFIEPCLPELWERPPHTEQWVHEIKHDGYRIQVHLHDTGAERRRTRGAVIVTVQPILAATGLFAARSAVLDGEVVVETASGHSDFGALQDDLGARPSDRLVFYAFDLLHLDGFELRGCALLDRKRVLYELIGERSGPIRFVEHLEGDGRTIYRNACKLELEASSRSSRARSMRAGGAVAG